MDETTRPAKRMKLSDSASIISGTKDAQSKNQSRRWGSRSKRQVSASGINAGEVGIFVTCDKGHERKSLDELADLVDEYLEMQKVHGVQETRSDKFAGESEARQEDFVEARQHNGEDEAKTFDTSNAESGTSLKRSADDIESELLAELADIKSNPQKQSNHISSDPGSSLVITTKLGLVTLDIPCVSFLRLPTSVDPVRIVYHICSEAAKNQGKQRSRYIKRMTPVSTIRKVLSEGLEECCDAMLPSGFRPGSGETNRDVEDGVGTIQKHGWKYKIQPTIRNNDKLHRDEVIEIVANKVVQLGNKDGVQHKVDLKGWEKCVLVDVYRNVVGMSVVGVVNDGGVSSEVNGFRTIEEEWKRFNLSEIYAEGRRKADSVKAQNEEVVEA